MGGGLILLAAILCQVPPSQDCRLRRGTYGGIAIDECLFRTGHRHRCRFAYYRQGCQPCFVTIALLLQRGCLVDVKVSGLRSIGSCISKAVAWCSFSQSGVRGEFLPAAVYLLHLIGDKFVGQRCQPIRKIGKCGLCEHEVDGFTIVSVDHANADEHMAAVFKRLGVNKASVTDLMVCHRRFTRSECIGNATPPRWRGMRTQNALAT
jgi:hypothetical protein